MNTSLSIKDKAIWEIDKYRRPKDTVQLRNTHVAFSGAPRKHPHDPHRVILVVDPCSGNTFYYEFQIDDISYVEDLPNLVNLDNEVVPMVRIWVLKQSIAIRSTPFIVEDLIR
jgi:inorganic pyrophosphatase